VNSIPQRAAIKVDIRSEQERDIARVETALRDAIRAGISGRDGGVKCARNGASEGAGIDMQIRAIWRASGRRTGGGSPLLQSVMTRIDFWDRSRTERSSTDANVPLSEGIPAISIGGGGNAEGRILWANGMTLRAGNGIETGAADSC